MKYFLKLYRINILATLRETKFNNNNILISTLIRVSFIIFQKNKLAETSFTNNREDKIIFN